MLFPSRKRRIIKNRVFFVYLIGIHLLLGVVLIKSDFIQRVERKLGSNTTQNEITENFSKTLCYHSRMDANVPNKSVIFIGDSIMRGLAVNAVVCPAVNYGIENDTTVGILRRLPIYKSIDTASAVVIAIGINDMKYRSNEEILFNLRSIADQIPGNVPVIFSAILPRDEEIRDERKGDNQGRIRDFNSRLERFTKTSKRLFFVDAGPLLIDCKGNLADVYHVGDGLHLNSQGNAIWIEQLKEALHNSLKLQH
ncbi:hypothetical protein EG832_13335 [bacterium]|nr:hypothetical protein [bacterium]